MPGIKHFKIEEGSDKIKIVNLFKNKQGYIYAGTSKGLYKFDGIKFTVIPFQNPVSDPFVTAIYQDAKKQLWVGFKNGDIATLTNNFLKLITPEEGTPKKPITAFLEDRENNLWFSTDGEGIYYFAGKHLYNINTTDGLSDNGIYTMALSDKGEIFAGSDQGISVCTVNGNKKIVKILSSKDGLPDNFIKKIIPAGNNDFLIAMQDKGLCVYNTTTASFTTPPQFLAWSYGQINQVLPAQNGLWIATENNGIIKSSGTLSTVADIKNEYGDLANINDIIQDNEGNIWLLSNNNELINAGGAV